MCGLKVELWGGEAPDLRRNVVFAPLREEAEDAHKKPRISYALELCERESEERVGQCKRQPGGTRRRTSRSNERAIEGNESIGCSHETVSGADLF